MLSTGVGKVNPNLCLAIRLNLISSTPERSLKALRTRRNYPKSYMEGSTTRMLMFSSVFMMAPKGQTIPTTGTARSSMMRARTTGR